MYADRLFLCPERTRKVQVCKEEKEEIHTNGNKKPKVLGFCLNNWYGSQANCCES